MVALRSWGIFSVPSFFPKMISQGAAKIGSRSKLVTENQLARASHQNHPFQKIGTLNDRPVAGNWPLLPTVLRAGARKGARAGRRSTPQKERQWSATFPKTWSLAEMLGVIGSQSVSQGQTSPSHMEKQQLRVGVWGKPEKVTRQMGHQESRVSQQIVLLLENRCA